MRIGWPPIAGRRNAEAIQAAGYKVLRVQFEYGTQEGRKEIDRSCRGGDSRMAR
jgi:hypothetical protein